MTTIHTESEAVLKQQINSWKAKMETKRAYSFIP